MLRTTEGLFSNQQSKGNPVANHELCRPTNATQQLFALCRNAEGVRLKSKPKPTWAAAPGTLLMQSQRSLKIWMGWWD
jgi:hypothetical protein